ncbi:MAG: SoxR reducing system RseC family protein [Clostridiales bacterium]|nr:SoxR reducing system RseC family protein [Clostridiales bacterium]
MTDVCTVKKIKGKLVYIELTRGEKCEGCQVCAFNKRESLVVPAVSNVEVHPGETVIAEMPTESVGVGSLLIYAVPLLLTVVGALIGLVGGLWLQVGLAAAGLGLGFLSAWLIDRAYRRREGVLPRIVGHYKQEQVQSTTDTDENKGE